ncbi:unnamed protein product [Hermetia illucens]|uniref:CHK kinase-like domain-containing protein n=2 Tax=Hermetia illucens TaxID=343691 RepID=A0A7R8UTX2_HERIL|nr:unnamed protein product [Hermetia illucens]
MLTLCYKVQVVLEENGNEYKLFLVVKKTPSVPEEVYNGTGFDNLFSNEIAAYTATLPALGDTSKYVKYYYSGRKKAEAFIVLGDFSVLGYKMSEKRYDLSLEHILLAVKLLGEFHGQGYGLKLSNPEKFKSVIGMIKQSKFLTDIPDTWTNILTQSTERFKNNINKSELPKIIPQEFLDNLVNLMTDYVGLAKLVHKPVEPVSTICHGDYLRNNIAFKYSPTNPGVPTEVIMFDFQTIVYASPMVDLTTLLALSAGTDVRSDKFHVVFKAYWDTLIENVCKVGGMQVEDVPEFLSYNSMVKEFIKYYPLGIRIATFFLMEMVEPIDYSPQDFIVDTKEDIFNVETRGGKTVDKAIRSMILELYNFTVEYKVDIFQHYEHLKNL